MNEYNLQIILLIKLIIHYSDVDPTFFVDGRFKTYKYWPFDDDKPCNKRAMAEAGFVSLGSSLDHVECFICSKQLDGWEEDDDPWEEHKKHQATCPFILLGKKDELELRIEEIYALLKIFYLKDLVSYVKI